EPRGGRHPDAVRAAQHGMNQRGLAYRGSGRMMDPDRVSLEEVREMRWIVGAFYAAMVTSVALLGGPKAAAYVLFGILAVVVMLRPGEAGRAITDWAERLFRHRAVSSSSSG